MFIVHAALYHLRLNMQNTGVGAGRQVQSRRVDLQIERIGARGRVIKKKEKGRIEKRHAAPGGKGARARKGGVGSCIETPGHVRRRDIVACPIRQRRRRAGKICVFRNRAEQAWNRPGSCNADGRASG